MRRRVILNSAIHQTKKNGFQLSPAPREARAITQFEITLILMYSNRVLCAMEKNRRLCSAQLLVYTLLINLTCCMH